MEPCESEASLATQIGVQFLCDFHAPILGFLPASSCTGLMHTLIVTVSSYVHLPCNVQERLFSSSHTLPLVHNFSAPFSMMVSEPREE